MISSPVDHGPSSAGPANTITATELTSRPRRMPIVTRVDMRGVYYTSCLGSTAGWLRPRRADHELPTRWRYAPTVHHRTLEREDRRSHEADTPSRWPIRSVAFSRFRHRRLLHDGSRPRPAGGRAGGGRTAAHRGFTPERGADSGGTVGRTTRPRFIPARAGQALATPKTRPSRAVHPRFSVVSSKRL